MTANAGENLASVEKICAASCQPPFGAEFHFLKKSEEWHQIMIDIEITKRYTELQH